MKNWKPVFGVLLNIVAITAPVAALYARYGVAERVSLGSDAFGQLFALGGATLAAFALGFIASNLMKHAETSYANVLSVAIQSLRVQSE